MITCPYCGSPLDEKSSLCGQCGKPYWQAGQSQPLQETETDTDEEEHGCLPVLFLPLALSFLVAVSLICIGFVFQALNRLTDIRIKALWILCSLAAGGAVYVLFSRLKKNKS